MYNKTTDAFMLSSCTSKTSPKTKKVNFKSNMQLCAKLNGC